MRIVLIPLLKNQIIQLRLFLKNFPKHFKNRIIILCGISGIGKGLIINILAKRYNFKIMSKEIKTTYFESLRGMVPPDLLPA